MQVYLKGLRWFILSLSLHFLIFSSSVYLFYRDYKFEFKKEKIYKKEIVKERRFHKKVIKKVEKRVVKKEVEIENPYELPFDYNLLPSVIKSCNTIRKADVKAIFSKGKSEVIKKWSKDFEGDGDYLCYKALEKIEDYIKKNLTYPYIARQLQLSGKMKIKLKISKGSIGFMKIVKSTGYEILDQNAIEILKKVEGLPECKKYLIIPIEYKLEF